MVCRWRVNIVLVVAIVAASLGATDVSQACKFASAVHQISSQTPIDPPGPIENISVSVKRGDSGGGGCGSQMSSSCDDIGSIGIHFRPPARADLPAESIGYRVTLIDGEPPGLGMIPQETMQASSSDGPEEATLFFHWSDSHDDSFIFSVTLTPIGPAGEEGPASGPIRIRHGGSGGCSIRNTWGADPLPVMTLVAVLALAGARRVGSRQRQRSFALDGA